MAIIDMLALGGRSSGVTIKTVTRYCYTDTTNLFLCHLLQACDEFFTLLSVCHTVLPSMETGTLEYNAQSPDEAALVAAAKNFGYVFKV